MTSPLLSIVLPAYNEEARIEASLNSIFDYFASRQLTFEILVVDDGSTDRTPIILNDYCSRVGAGSVRHLRNRNNRGKGYSVRRGMLASAGQFGLMTDCDLSAPITEFPKLEQKVVEEGFDIALGSRDLPESDVQHSQPGLRESLGKLFNRLVRLSTPLPFKDTQCGFKLFRMKTCRDIFEHQTIDGYVFDVEILFVALKWKLRVSEIPVTWSHEEGSKVRVLGDAPSAIVDLARIHLNNARGKYDITA